MTKNERLRNRAAKALDLSLPLAHRGPKTVNIRERVAEALDLGKPVTIRDIEWLEYIIHEF
jgi:hypothetical protein